MPKASNLKSQKEKSSVGSFFSSMASDISNTINFSKLSADEQFEHKAKTEVYRRAAEDRAAYYDSNDKPRRATPSRAVPVYVAKTTEQFYNELKVDFGPLPSLRSETASSYSKPVYSDIGLIQREGGEVRSLFNPYG